MRKFSLSVVLFSASLLSAQTTDKVVAGEPSHEARLINYQKRTVADISTQLRTEVAIVLPDQEKVLAVSCGDENNWPTAWNPQSNVVVIKPAKAGLSTSMNIQTDHGNVYTFAVKDVSLIPGAHADLKVYVEPSDPVMKEALQQAPKYVDARVAEEYRHAAELARADADQARTDSKVEMERVKAKAEAKAPTTLKHDYDYDKSKKAAFKVTDISHDDRFTYICGSFQEPPAIFEMKDGQPALIAYDYEDGVYVIRKVINEGSLRVGKKQMSFRKVG